MSGLRSERRKTATLQGRKKFSKRFMRKMQSGTLGRFCRPENYTGAKPDIGRNDPCPCGSGLKAKRCCLK